MDNVIQLYYATPALATVYFIVYANGNLVNASSGAIMSLPANWSLAVIPATDVSMDRHYTANMPAVQTGTYNASAFLRVGASPDEAVDILIGNSGDFSHTAGNVGDCNCYASILDIHGNPIVGAKLHVRMILSPNGSGNTYDMEIVETSIADSNGLAQINLIRGAYYRYWVTSGRYREVKIPDLDTFALPNV